ncbi:MAG: putative polyprenyl diphosphate synthase [Candidatus Saccharibacteria bacterium]|nr:putative polyprenyl diphosphate synthase [Candidatus Saccharibacteria bacterium]
MEKFDFKINNLAAYLEQVDQKLKSVGTKDIPGLDRMLVARGKRLRPSLVIAIAEYCGVKIDEKVITAAAAVELVHLASLVHDDIIDNGTLRWGVPTINTMEGATAALLAGDYLLAKGCALAASCGAQAGVVMAETIASLCEGQAKEIADQFNIARTVESLNAAIKGKTCSMFVAACTLGGLAAMLDSEDTNTLSEFAEYFGLAFQYMDDISDFTNSRETTGKSATSDIQTGNYTLPVILSLQRPNKAKLNKLLKTPNTPTQDILNILIQDRSINKAQREAQFYLNNAVKSLSKLKNNDLKNGLTNLIKF